MYLACNTIGTASDVLTAAALTGAPGTETALGIYAFIPQNTLGTFESNSTSGATAGDCSRIVWNMEGTSTIATGGGGTDTMTLRFYMGATPGTGTVLGVFAPIFVVPMNAAQNISLRAEFQITRQGSATSALNLCRGRASFVRNPAVATPTVVDCVEQNYLSGGASASITVSGDLYMWMTVQLNTAASSAGEGIDFRSVMCRVFGERKQGWIREEAV